MCAVQMTPRPNKSWSGIGLLIFLCTVLTILPGCTPKLYKAVPECKVESPPDGERFVKGNPDERLVMMTSAYIGQTKSVAKCNATIRLFNVANKAVSE